MTPLQQRAAAAQATRDRFYGKPFRYGMIDCVRMGAFHLRQMGHSVRLPPSGSYRSARAGMAALRERGFATLIEAMDSFGFERIAPAAALVGDVIATPAEGPFGGGLCVALGNGRVIGFHQEAVGGSILQPVEFVAAWRIDPRSPR